MLDILIVHPNAAKKIYQKLSNHFSAIEPPIWAAMIGQYLLNCGFSIDILDCEALNLSIEESFQKVKDLSPKIVAMVVYGQQPSASAQNMFGASLLMERIKELNSARIYIGPTPTAMPEYIISRDKECFVCAGEGPITLKQLLKIKDFYNVTNLEKVLGLCFYNEKEKRIVKNPQAPLLENLDVELPSMAWNLLPMDNYRTANWHGWTNNLKISPFASLYTSLGCPFQCDFCMINAPFNRGNSKNNRIRYWSPEHIIKTFDFFANRGITNIKIADEMFVLNPSHFLKICELIIKRGHKFNMWAYARIDTTKQIYLDTLKKAGVNWLGFGIESANYIIRQESTKGKFGELTIKDTIAKVENSGICTTGNYMFGLPNDTLETMNETLRLALELETSYANFYSTLAYPGSSLHYETSKTHPEYLPENNEVGWLGYSQHSYETLNLPTKFISNSQVLEFRERAFKTFFENQEYVERMTKKFGPTFKSEIQKMLNIKLLRKLLE